MSLASKVLSHLKHPKKSGWIVIEPCTDVCGAHLMDFWWLASEWIVFRQTSIKQNEQVFINNIYCLMVSKRLYREQNNKVGILAHVMVNKHHPKLHYRILMTKIVCSFSYSENPSWPGLQPWFFKYRDQKLWYILFDLKKKS